MVKKKTKVDDLEDFEMEPEPEVQEFDEEQIEEQEPQDVAKEFMKSIDEKLEKLTNAISTNQKYIKELYATQKVLEQRQDGLDNNFKILLRDLK